MEVHSIKNIEYLKIVDDKSQKSYYGCNQEWYRTRWQRLSGCGPSVVSNIIHYLNRSGVQPLAPPITKKDFLLHMEEVWGHVTPTLRGIPTTVALCSGAESYLSKKGLNLRTEALDIPENRAQRPDFADVLAFIDEALDADRPVAFLNLHHGDEKRLDSWHWVTIVRLEHTQNGSSATAEILDEGIVKKIDLARWFLTTTLGGGLVRFFPIK